MRIRQCKKLETKNNRVNSWENLRYLKSIIFILYGRCHVHLMYSTVYKKSPYWVTKDNQTVIYPSFSISRFTEYTFSQISSHSTKIASLIAWSLLGIQKISGCHQRVTSFSLHSCSASPNRIYSSKLHEPSSQRHKYYLNIPSWSVLQ